MNKTILTIGHGECRYPLWDDKVRPTIESPLCGGSVKPGNAYCREHAAICEREHERKAEFKEAAE